MKKPATTKTTTNNEQIITINTNNDNKNKNKNKGNSSGSGSKTTTACCSKMGIKRGPWTAEEDEVLSDFIRREGEGRWRTLPNRAGLSRCGKSCRLRWMNYLRPSIKRGRIAPDEEDLILRLHRLLGNRWSLIAGRIPGRTDNEIKNYWNTHLSKKLISQGIDPRTHKPLAFKPNDHQTNNKNIPSSSSSFKTNHLMFPKNPNNDNFQTSTVGEDQTYNKENSYLPVDHVDLGGPYQTTGEVANFQGYENLPSSDGFDVCLRSSTSPNHVPGNYEEDNINVDDLNCSVDDVLSSFLNSLINEEAFSGAPNGIAPLSTDAFGVPENNASDGWESAVTSCTNDLQREVDDRVE